MSITAYYLTPQDELRKNLDEEEISTALKSGEGVLWVDINETSEEDGDFLERVFGFHNLFVEDCISPRIHPPKIDEYGDYLFIIVHGINHVVESDIVETAEMNMFLGGNYVVSNHSFPLYNIDAIRQLVETDGRPLRRGADFLAHALIDVLIDNVIPTIDKMSDVAEEIEEETIQNPQQSTLEAILKLKRSTLRIHRVMAPQREILNRLSRREFTIIRDEVQIFYRDVYDHITRIEDLNQALRDRADNALATHLSSVANRQNETMRVLSIVATIFLPLTLLAGIYGMNFENMPELKISWAYFAVLGFMAAVVFLVVWRFWASNWFAWGRKKIRRVNLFMAEPADIIGHLGKLTKRSHWLR